LVGWWCGLRFSRCSGSPDPLLLSWGEKMGFFSLRMELSGVLVSVVVWENLLPERGVSVVVGYWEEGEAETVCFLWLWSFCVFPPRYMPDTP